jgi:hypothetical protein
MKRWNYPCLVFLQCYPSCFPRSLPWTQSNFTGPWKSLNPIPSARDGECVQAGASSSNGGVGAAAPAAVSMRRWGKAAREASAPRAGSSCQRERQGECCASPVVGVGLRLRFLGLAMFSPFLVFAAYIPMLISFLFVEHSVWFCEKAQT